MPPLGAMVYPFSAPSIPLHRARRSGAQRGHTQTLAARTYGPPCLQECSLMGPRASKTAQIHPYTGSRGAHITYIHRCLRAHKAHPPPRGLVFAPQCLPPNRTVFFDLNLYIYIYIFIFLFIYLFIYLFIFFYLFIYLYLYIYM